MILALPHKKNRQDMNIVRLNLSRSRVSTILRDAAFVLRMTQRVKESMVLDAHRPTSRPQ